MKRVITDYQSLNDEVRTLVDEAYPRGVRKEDLLAFPTSKGRRLYGVEIRTEDVIYLVKIPDRKPQQGNGFQVLSDKSDEAFADEEE